MLALFRDCRAVESEGEDMHTVRVEIPLGDPADSKPKGRKKAFLHFGNRPG